MEGVARQLTAVQARQPTRTSRRTQLKPGPGNSLEGWGAAEAGGGSGVRDTTDEPGAAPCCCLVQTNAILSSNYPSQLKVNF